MKVEAENRIIIANYEFQEREIRARANKLEASSLSDNLLKKMAIEKWNGELPTTVSGKEGLNILIGK